MNKNYIPTLIVIVLGIMIQSCEKENPPLQEKDQTVDTVETPDIVYHPRRVKVTIAGRTKVTHPRRAKVTHL